MVVTGSSILNAFSLVNILLPLWPSWILLVQRTERTAAANWLLALCLYCFCQNVLLYLPSLQTFLPLLHPIARLAEFVLQYYLLRQVVSNGKARDLMQLLLVAFLSVLITLFCLRGITAYYKQIDTIQSGALIFLSFISLVQLTGQRQIIIFRSPVFWIACGTLCYYSMEMLIEYLTGKLPVSPEIQQQKILLITVSNVMRMAAFTVASRIKTYAYY